MSETVQDHPEWDAHLKAVAKIYRQALAEGLHPDIALQEAMEMKPPTAMRWIKEAMKRGYLGDPSGDRAADQGLPGPAQARQMREELGMTRTDLAREIGTGRNMLRHWEAGTKIPQPENRAAWIGALRRMAAEGTPAAPVTEPPAP